MLEISLILIMSIALLSLTIISIALFSKHLNFMHAFIKEMRQNQILLHREILDLKLDRTKTQGIQKSNEIKYEKNNKKTQTNQDITDLKSSEVSEEELSKLMEGKELGI